MAKGNVNLALANATPYLDMFGHLIIGWKWLEMAEKAQENLRSSGVQNTDFYKGKVIACQYFFRYEFCRINAWAALVSAIDETTFTATNDIF